MEDLAEHRLYNLIKNKAQMSYKEEGVTWIENDREALKINLNCVFIL